MFQRQSNYLIELRLNGYAKKYARETMHELVRKFRLRDSLSSGGVPHVTIYGPFSTTDERRMVGTVVDVCRRYLIIPFKFRGFHYFDNPVNKVIFLDVAPSEELRQFRYDLAQALRTVTDSKSTFDRLSPAEFYFHSTLVFRNIQAKFPQILNYIKEKQEPNINQVVLRLTILRNGKILHEYDFMQRKLLNRFQSLNRHILRNSVTILRNKRVNYGDVAKQRPSGEPEDAFDEEPRSTSLWQRLIRWFRGG